jgi:hypothetical protein
MARSAGSGNLRWRTSRILTQCKKGNRNRKRCVVIRKNGTRCNGIAVKNFDRCFHHGGSGVLAKRRLYTAKRKRWRVPYSQLKDEAQLKEEARIKWATLVSDFPVE